MHYVSCWQDVAMQNLHVHSISLKRDTLVLASWGCGIMHQICMWIIKCPSLSGIIQYSWLFHDHAPICISCFMQSCLKLLATLYIYIYMYMVAVYITLSQQAVAPLAIGWSSSYGMCITMACHHYRSSYTCELSIFSVTDEAQKAKLQCSLFQFSTQQYPVSNMVKRWCQCGGYIQRMH